MAEAQPRNDAARVTIMRASGEKQTVDLNDSAALVRTGDVINVSARQQEFYYIGGRVSYPGQKPFQSGITLLQAILAAGGTARQNDNNIDLSREGVEGRLTTTRYKLHRYLEHPLGELYDLQEDPGELVNRFDDPAYASVRSDLLALCDVSGSVRHAADFFAAV